MQRRAVICGQSKVQVGQQDLHGATHVVDTNLKGGDMDHMTPHVYYYRGTVSNKTSAAKPLEFSHKSFIN